MALRDHVITRTEAAVPAGPGGCWRVVVWVSMYVKVSLGIPLDDNHWASDAGWPTREECEAACDRFRKELAANPPADTHIEAIEARFFPDPGK